MAKVVWWTLQGTILDHTREFMRRRAHRTTAAVHNSAATDERLLTAKLLPETAMAPGLVDEPTGSAWPFDRPLVSVVIPCFNYGHLVGEAIRSVEAQTFQDLEIIVVEGGSSSPESRERLIEAMSAGSPRVRLLIQDKPYRAGANRNFGISHARGKYICCLDADDRLAPTFVEKAVFMLEHSGYDVVSPGLRVFGNKSEVWTPHDRPTLDMLVEANNVVTCAMFRRTYWREAGGYRDSDPATGHIHEDWLFWVRLAALGARFVSIREPLLEYRSHGRTLSNGRSVLENEVQKLQIQRFNADVLTEENLLAARQKSATNPPRPPQTFQHRPVRSTAKHGPTVLLAMPFLILGGAERLLSSVVAHLTKSGWRVIVVTTIPIDQSHGDTTSWFSPSTTEIFHLPRFLDQEYWRDFLNHLVDSRAVDVVWVAGSAFVYDYLPALKLRHPTLGVADLLFNTVGHTTNNRRYADCIDLTFVENREVKQWLLEAGELNDRISLVESGVDLKSYAPAEVNQDFLDSEGIPTGAIVVGYFGRWSDEKDPIGFVEIAKLVSEELDVVFVMTGAGPLDANLQEAIASAKFPKGRFLMKGAVPDIKPYVQACDILVLPSKMDGRPTVVMEALASGVPVVASRVGALPEIFEDGRQGYLCTPGDYKSFAESITELALDERKLTQFKHDARLLAEERLNIQTMLKTYETGLRKLIGA
ncbi:glycosyltransferase [Variovorax ureilyticus]|uniref:glycosyltransferase n=1 Tax=Variovorax ureilyticus TaxID=1836198 RepID=UPI003D66F917